MDYKERAELFKILSNPVRLQILDLVKDKPQSLQELTDKIGIRKPNVSQHLLPMRLMKIIKVEHRAQEAIYSLAKPEVEKYL